MATFVLDGKSTVTLPRGPLAATLATSSGDRSGVRLSARYGDGAPAQAVQASATMLILPRVDREVTIVARPDGGRAQFDDGTVLHLSIGPESSGHDDGDLAQVAPRDVSGLAVIELAMVSVGPGDALTVASKVSTPDTALPPLAAQARGAARGVLGVDHEPAERCRAVRVLVDTSASMAPLFASGAVAAAADVVAGLAAVIGDDDRVQLLLPGPWDAPAREVPGAGLGTELLAAPAGGLGLGARLTPPPTTGTTLTVLITDGAGAALAAAEPAPGTVVLAIGAVRSVRDRPGFAGAVCPPPPPGGDAREALAAHPDLVRTITADLLRAADRPGRHAGVTR